MSNKPIIPGVKYEFSEPFRSQFIEGMRRSEARAAARARGEQVQTDPPTPKQKMFLQRRKLAIPETKRQASELIGRIKRQEGERR